MMQNVRMLTASRLCSRVGRKLSYPSQQLTEYAGVCRVGRRLCKTVSEAADLSNGEKGAFAAIGILGGGIGAIVGIGGGNVMVPLMTLATRCLTQHQITATSLVAVVGTGAASAISYLSLGAIDATSAGLITVMATGTAPIGARLASQLSPQRLRLCLAVFVLVCAPLVPLKGLIFTARESQSKDGESSQNLSLSSAIVVCATGALAGMTSGLLGIGGGVVLTPALALATDLPQLTILGTSLTAMILPSITGAVVHYRAGTISLAAGIPLCVGAAAGAQMGSRFAAGLPEVELRWTFAGVMGVIGAIMLRKAL